MRVQFNLRTKTTNILDITDEDLGTILFALSQIQENVRSEESIATVKRIELTLRDLSLHAELIKE
jgi:hypothetical protein